MKRFGVGLSPLEVLFDNMQGIDIPLSLNLSHLYGTLRFPGGFIRPYIISNFVTTLDGVVSWGIPGKAGGDGISGGNRHDSAVMGMLRAVSDAVIIGSNNLAVSSRHIWTPEHVFPDLADDYQELRRAMGKEATPLNVIVTANAHLDFSLPIFQSGKAKVLVVTTVSGAELIRRQNLPEWVSFEVAGCGPLLSAKEIVNAIMLARPTSTILLVEGGPHLMGTFFGDNFLDELFLTLSSQVAGRSNSPERLGLVEAKVLAPENPVWGTLASIRRVEDLLFLRYKFKR